jgi:serine protease Do
MSMTRGYTCLSTILADFRPSSCVPAVFCLILLAFGTLSCSQEPEEFRLARPASNGGDSQSTPSPAPSASNAVLSNETFVSVAKQARQVVVNISSVRNREAGKENSNPFFDDPFFRRFFGEEFGRRFQPPPEFREQGLGSGVMVSMDGYILTNSHVVEGADEIEIHLPDGRRFAGALIGADSKTDIAVVKIPAENLPVLEWADSSKLQIGEIVLAIGNPFGLNQTVTQGIISGVGRAHMGIVDYEDFIQTDAAINPGNSGGALVNLNGELVGINTAIFSRTGGSMGIGFAIPINMARTVMMNLIEHGKVIRGWLGISIQDLTPELAGQFGVRDTNGAVVTKVFEDSPAAKAGLQRGDIITTYNGKSVKDSVALRMMVADTLPDATVPLTVIRDEQSQKLSVTIGELPKEIAASVPPEQKIERSNPLAGVRIGPLSESPKNYPPGQQGVLVTQILPGTPAARSGIRKGDIILEVNRQPITSINDFQKTVAQLPSQKPVLLLIERNGAIIFLTIQSYPS